MRVLLVPSLVVALGACAGATTRDVPRHLFADRLFEGPARPAGEDLFAVSEPMRDFARTHVVPAYRGHGAQDGLARALKDELRVEYEATATTPASLTFASRSGNCLSLVILTAAFAKHLGIPFQYQSVYGFDTWSRADGIAFLSGHVNLRLGTTRQEGLTIDFLAPEGGRQRFTRVIGEREIVAMYHNNRAAEALVEGQLDSAYWHARAAVEAAPAFVPAHNTLGLVYQRRGAFAEAEATLRHALAREPENAQVLGNLANVLERAQRPREARALREALARIDPHPPFQFLDEGLAALAAGDAAAALPLLERELRRMPFNEEVHFALARARQLRGESRRAERHLALALEYSTTRDRREIYGAKLAHLKARAD